MSITVVEYLIKRLENMGVQHVFGVPGDYAFPVNDAVSACEDMDWVGCSNELNAAYSADGYARIKGIAALSTTFGVGELSALNGIAGSYAEYVPVVHLVGMPSRKVQATRSMVHHTLGNGDFHAFYRASEEFVCAQTILDGDNCIEEVERVLNTLLEHRRPIYIGLPADTALEEVNLSTKGGEVFPVKESVVSADDVASGIISLLSKAKAPCVLPGILSRRFGCEELLEEFLEKTSLPYATMFMDKALGDESSSSYIGMYCGNLLQKNVAEYVESSDCLLSIGTQFTDFNTGAFTALLPEQHISIMPDHVVLGSKKITHLNMKDVLSSLLKKIDRLPRVELPGYRGDVSSTESAFSSDGISLDVFYKALQKFIQPHDIVVAETGTLAMGVGFMRLSHKISFQTQGLWGSIGWATPAALGMSLAAPERRVILMTGEGAHQLTAQAVGDFHYHGCKPIIMVVNNEGYLIERLLCKNPEDHYNDVARWDYTLLPKALGCTGWHVAQVKNGNALKACVEEVSHQKRAAYIEIVMERYEAPEMAVQLGCVANNIHS